jgi:hypothetical protein
MSNLFKTFFFVAMTYFLAHIFIGASYCYTNFCPGDSEDDWVYEYTDEDTDKRMIVIDGKPMLKDDWERKIGVGKYDPDKE